MPDTTDSTPAAERDWAATELALLLVMEATPSIAAEFFGRSVAAWWNNRTTFRPRIEWIVILRAIRADPDGFRTSNLSLPLEKLGIPVDWRSYRQLVNAGRKRQRPRCRPITEQEILSD